MKNPIVFLVLFAVTPFIAAFIGWLLSAALAWLAAAHHSASRHKIIWRNSVSASAIGIERRYVHLPPAAADRQ